MARTYLVDSPATFIDGEPLDAWTARQRVQIPPEAIYEEARDDGRVVMAAYYEYTDTTKPWGPMPIRMRRDRSGLWRTQYIDILYAPGSYDKLETWAVITDTWRWPVGDAMHEHPSGRDPYCYWTPDTTVTPDWLGAQAITIPRDWSPSIVERGAEADRGTMRIAWLTVWIMDDPGAPTAPRICGYRHYESVSDEP